MSKRKPIRLAHISDMHCYRLTLSLTQFLSKRWLGNINVLVNRRISFHKDPNSNLLDLFHSQGVNHVIVSGDVSTTSLSEEFAVAAEFMKELEDRGMKTHLIPGNHDNYTRQAHRQGLFYQFFDGASDGHDFHLREEKVALRRLGDNCWLIGLDTTIPTPLLLSKGVFSEAIEANLEQLLKEIPSDHHVILTNHFPLFETVHPSHDLERSPALRNLLKSYPNVRLYLHGHVHRQSIRDKRRMKLPICLNSGSCGLKRRATCHIIDLTDEGCEVAVWRYHQRKTAGLWKEARRASFQW
ncbi:MAG: metallophosphoesterase [Parachlamydiales bacterium]